MAPRCGEGCHGEERGTATTDVAAVPCQPTPERAGVRQTSRMSELEPVPSSYPVVLDGQRLRLGEVGLTDFDDAWAWSSDERVFRYLPVEQPADREAERLWLESVMAEATGMPRRHYQIGIELADTGSLGGMARIGVGSERHRSANIGYGVAPRSGAAAWPRRRRR